MRTGNKFQSCRTTPCNRDGTVEIYDHIFLCTPCIFTFTDWRLDAIVFRNIPDLILYSETHHYNAIFSCK